MDDEPITATYAQKKTFYYNLTLAMKVETDAAGNPKPLSVMMSSCDSKIRATG